MESSTGPSTGMKTEAKRPSTAPSTGSSDGAVAPPPSPASITSPDGGAKRVRRGKKRLRFTKLPRPVYPVRALWDAASEEEKRASHRLCVGILEWWLGKATRTEVAAKLSLPGLRLWQLSQQALAGMLAGLLRQPRVRGKVTLPPSEGALDVPALKRRTAELEKRLKQAEDVAFVLGELKDAALLRPKPLASAPSAKALSTSATKPSSQPKGTAAAKGAPRRRTPSTAEPHG